MEIYMRKQVKLSLTERAKLIQESIGVTVIEDSLLQTVAGGGCDPISTRPRSSLWVDSCVKPGQQCP